jgi:hypothetical protein
LKGVYLIRGILTKLKYIIIFLILIIGLAILLFSIKFYKDKEIVGDKWNQTQVSQIKNIGSVRKLSVIPLVESDTKSDNLIGEPAVSYLIKADGKYILFDLGWNSKKENPSPLLKKHG